MILNSVVKWVLNEWSCWT